MTRRALAVIGTRPADRQNDFEDCPMRVTRRYREPTAVRFDNRSANCEAHSHAVGLGGEESIEDAIDISWREAGAGILDPLMAISRQWRPLNLAR